MVHPFDDRVVLARGAAPPMIADDPRRDRRRSSAARVVDADGGDATVTGPAFVDSRVAERGGLFVAVAGERVDGHDFADAAVRAGAAAVLASRDTGAPGRRRRRPGRGAGPAGPARRSPAARVPRGAR